jgi:hypothetical protein
LDIKTPNIYYGSRDSNGVTTLALTVPEEARFFECFMVGAGGAGGAGSSGASDTTRGGGGSGGGGGQVYVRIPTFMLPKTVYLVLSGSIAPQASYIGLTPYSTEALFTANKGGVGGDGTTAAGAAGTAGTATRKSLYPQVFFGQTTNGPAGVAGGSTGAGSNPAGVAGAIGHHRINPSLPDVAAYVPELVTMYGFVVVVV